MRQNKDLKFKYPPETAGRRMIKNVPLAFPQERIFDVRKRIFEKAQEFETLNYIYVVDKENRLVGVISLKEIFQKLEETKIRDLMIKELIVAHPYADQERVVILALKHNLKSIPIVDKEGKFLGIVPSDIILEILHSEHIEDILYYAGISKYNTYPAKTLQAPASILAKLRLPWLIFGFGGGLIAAKIVSFFETPLKTNLILVFFMPLVLYITAATGSQTLILFIRNLTFGQKFPTKFYFFKEIKINLLIALILAALLSLISIFWSGIPYLGMVLGVSLFLTIISAVCISILIPWLLLIFKKDPVLGSGPFVHIFTDISTLIIYFSIISLLLKLF